MGGVGGREGVSAGEAEMLLGFKLSSGPVSVSLHETLHVCSWIENEGRV